MSEGLPLGHGARGNSHLLVMNPDPRIAACGLNFADLLMMRGQYQERPALPAILGMEMAGTVTALGPDTDGPAPGTRVALYHGSGGLAEAGNLPADRAIPLLASIDFPTAAGFQIAYGTSHLALTRHAGLRAGETLLVLARRAASD